MGSFTYDVITEGGGGFQMMTIDDGGGGGVSADDDVIKNFFKIFLTYFDNEPPRHSIRICTPLNYSQNFNWSSSGITTKLPVQVHGKAVTCG